MTTIKNQKDSALQVAGSRTLLGALEITTTANSFLSQKNNLGITPALITLSASSSYYTPAAIKVWTYALSTDPSVWKLAGTGDSISINGAGVDAMRGTASTITYKCTASEAGLTTTSAYITISFYTEGLDSVVYYLDMESPVIFKNSASAIDSGTYANTITVKGKRKIGSDSPEDYGYVTLTPDFTGTTSAVAATEASTGTSSVSGITTETTASSWVTKYTARLYDTPITLTSLPSPGVPVDTQVIPIVFKGGNGISITQSNGSHNIPCDSSGNNSVYTNSGTHIYVYEGANILQFSTTTLTGATADAGKYNVAITTATNITAGSISLVGTDAIVGDHSGASTATIASIVYTITGYTKNLVAFSSTITQSFTRNRAGAASTGISLSSPTTSFAYTTAGITPSPASAVITAVAQNTTQTPYYEFFVGAASVQNTTSATYTYTPQANYSNMPETVTVKLREGSSTATVSTTSSLAMLATKPGATGNKTTIISCFGWFPGTPDIPSASYNYNWGSGTVSGYPTVTTAGGSTLPSPVTMTAAATTNTTAGLSLTMLTLTITAAADYTGDTAINWSTASKGSIGYTPSGGIGVKGDSARIAYTKSTIASPIGTTTSTGTSSLPATGSFGLTGSTFDSSPPPLTASGEFLYQTDGIYVESTNTITWSTPYLSNLKVGSLQAISANMGIVEIANPGNIHSTGISGAAPSATSGFFLGYDSGYKFSIGNSSNYLYWDGTNLSTQGIQIKDNSGAVVLSLGANAGSTNFLGNLTGSISGNAVNTVLTNITNATNTAGYAISSAGNAISSAGYAISSAGNAISSASNAISTSGYAVSSAGNAISTAGYAFSSASGALNTSSYAFSSASGALNTSSYAFSSASGALTTVGYALSSVSGALTTSGDALTTVGYALSTVLGASSAAAQALVSAGNAQSSAGYAISSASGAVSTAASAFSSASTALSTASSAFSSATTALATASSAFSSASTALTTASSAFSSASTALTSAGDALTTAGKAITTAGDALTTAGNAVTTAGNAITTAGKAITTSGYAISSAAAASSVAASALSGLSDKLSLTSANILTASGSIGLATEQAIWIGTNITNAATTGLYLGSAGIFAKKAGVTTFTITNAGEATFGGNLDVGGYSIFRGINTATLGFTSNIRNDTENAHIGVLASGIENGVRGVSNTLAGLGVVGVGNTGVEGRIGYSFVGGATYAGVKGIGNTSTPGVSGISGYIGVYAETSGTGTALYVAGPMQITTTSLVTNLNADKVDGKDASAFVEVASGTTNAKYYYYVNNTTAPSNTVAATWIKMSTNDGSVVWVQGYS